MRQVDDNEPNGHPGNDQSPHPSSGRSDRRSAYSSIKSTAPGERVRRLLIPAVIVGVGWLVLGVAFPSAGRLTNGFSAYYTAAKLIREGAPVARFYDDEWFRAQTIRLGFERAPDIYNINPPAASLLFWPLSTLDPYGA